MVTAVAGSGKTTVLEEVSKITTGKKLFLAFNKSIATELDKRLSGVEVKTMHSFGLQFFKRSRINANKNKQYLIDEIFEGEFKKALRHINPQTKAVSLCKAYGMNDYDGSVVKEIIEDHGIENLDMEIFKQMWEYQFTSKDIDFDDMIWKAVYFGEAPREYDWVMVDECQDLNPIMIQLLQMVKGRKLFVGDPAQAIYGFRGADKHAVPRIKAEFDCIELPLSVCYRCGSEIIKRAQTIVPTIEWHWEGGEVLHPDEFDPKEGDLVVCRVTADLVKGCLGLVAQGKGAHILGKEVQDNLLKVYKQCKGDLDKTKKCRSKVAQQAYDDTMDTLRAVREFSEDIVGTINKIFTGKKGVTFSTIHKSKGLEADNVWIIRPDLLPHPKATDLVQESNLEYVAITRAKKQLNIFKGEV